MAHHHVRIIRKPKTNAHMMLNWSDVLISIVKLFYCPQIKANLSVLQDAKLEEIRIRTQVADMRRIKLSNDIVIQEMKLEELKKSLQSRNIIPPDKTKDGNAY